MTDSDHSPELRVLIVAGNPLAQIGLGTMLNRVGGVAVIGQVSPGADLSAEIETRSPEVIIWDLESSAALEQIGAVTGSALILALVPDTNSAAEAWSAGARGVLPRSAAAEMITAAAAAVSQGLAVFDPTLASTLFPARVDTLTEELTGREREVLGLVAEGLPNKVIAAHLGISENTVKYHVNAIMSKLGVQSRTEAVVKAVRMGFLLL